MSSLRLPELCLRIGIVYLLIGLGLGTYMGLIQDHSLMTVHAHLNLLGFASTFLMGLFLKTHPAALESKWTRYSVLGILVFVPISLIALAAVYTGHTALGPVLGISTIGITASYVVFALELFRATKTA